MTEFTVWLTNSLPGYAGWIGEAVFYEARKALAVKSDSLEKCIEKLEEALTLVFCK